MATNDSAEASKKQRAIEIEEANRRKEAEEKRREAMLAEALKQKAIAEEKLEAEKRREQQVRVEPLSLKNADGSLISKDDRGRVIETLDARGEVRKFGYNANGELNSFTENGKEWKTSDGQNWLCDNEKSRTMRAVVNSEDGAFAKVEVVKKAGDAGAVELEAISTFAFVNGNVLTRTDQGSELRNKNDVVLERSDTVKESDAVKQTDRPALSAEQKQEQISQAAATIYANSSDARKVTDIIEPMTESERTQLKETYKNLYNVDLQDALNQNLYPSDAAQCEALLKRKEGVIDTTGHIYQALVKLKELAPSEYAKYSGQEESLNDSQVRSEKEVRDGLNSLTAAQIVEVKAKYQSDYGRDLEGDLLANENLSVATREALKVYLKGADVRTDADTLALADYALLQKRPDIFNDVFRDASQTARDQFKQADGYKRIDAAYTGDYGDVNNADAQISKDILDRGSVSIATIAAGNTHWYHTNKDDITRSMRNATEQDRKDFERGEQLKLADQTPTTADDIRALNYYNSVDSALRGAGDNREVAIWQAQLRNHGTFIADALSSRYEGFWFTGIGAATDKNKLIGSVENLTETDWSYLKSHPEELKTIDRALQTFEDNHREQVMSMLQQKLAAETFEQSQTCGNRDIEDRLTDCRDSKARVSAIEGMSQQERTHYVNNVGGLKDRLDAYFAPASELERQLFKRIVVETPGELSPLSRVLSDQLKGDVPSPVVIRHIEEAFKAEPTLRERMRVPQTEEDNKLSRIFHDAVSRAVTDAGLGPQFTKKDGVMIEGTDKQLKLYESLLFENGHVPLEKKVFLTSDNIERVDIISRADAADKARLLQTSPDEDTRRFQDMVLGTEGEREVALNALKQRDNNDNGVLSDADRFRLFALGDKIEQDDLRDKLARMTPAERQDLANEYYTKYKRLITSDTLEKVNEIDKWRFRELLSPTDISVRQIALDSQRALNSHTSDFDGALKKFWDYSRVSADSAQDNLNRFIVEHAKEIEKLTPEQRKQFEDAVDNFNQAQKNYIDSKGDFAEALVNATITVAAIGGALFTGGTSLTLLTTIGAGGALYRVAVMKAVQGSDFDSSARNIFKQGFEGGSAALLSFLGPESFGIKGFLVGEKLAGQTARKLVTDAATAGLFKAGSEKVMTSALASVAREGAIVGEQKIIALAEKIAADGVDRKLVEQAIRNQLKTDVTTGIGNKLLNEAQSYARNMAAAQIGGAGKEVLATVVALEDPQTLLSRLADTTISTAGGVSVFHFAFRGAASGFKAVNAIVGRDADGIFIGKGTIVEGSNGKRFQVAEDRYRPREGDRVAEQISESERYPLTLSSISETRSGAFESFSLEGRPLELNRQYFVGRTSDADFYIDDGHVSRQHLRVRVDEYGNRFITDLHSSNGTYVNGVKIAPGVEVYLRLDDSVRIGEHNLDFGIKKIADVLEPPPMPVRTELTPEAVKQSNDYSQTHQLDDPIQDGWSAAGRNSMFYQDGRFYTSGQRPAMVIDRVNDRFLNDALAEAKYRFGHHPPKLRAELLTKWAKAKFTPEGMDENALDQWYDAFSTRHNGKRIYFGEFLQAGRGVCSQQAILLKLAIDQFPDMKASLVRGNYFVPGSEDGGALNHVWTEISFAGSKPLVYDPRGGIFGLDYKAGKAFLHSPGRQFSKPPEGNDVVVNDRFWLADGKKWNVIKLFGDQAVISRDIDTVVLASELAALNPGKDLKIGDSCRVRRKDGRLEEGWIVIGGSTTGHLKVYKQHEEVRIVDTVELR